MGEYMTPDQMAVFVPLLDLLSEAYHKHDSALQVAKEVPDWKEKLDIAERDPARISRTLKKLAPIQKLADGIRVGVLDDEAWLQLLSEVERLTAD